MRKGKLKGLLILVLVLIVVTACGSVYAYMFKQTEDVKNEFVPAEVSCMVHEATNDNVTQKSSITVENTGNIDAYLRVRLVSYWVEDAGDGNYEIVSKASTLPEITTADGWLKGSNDTFYYKYPIAPDGFTPNLLSSVITLTQQDEYLQVIEVFAEAIQSKPSDAVMDSWGVTVDNAETITKVP